MDTFGRGFIGLVFYFKKIMANIVLVELETMDSYLITCEGGKKCSIETFPYRIIKHMGRKILLPLG